jgi:uncharacterized repeat protein (TIGR01451 family)
MTSRLRPGPCVLTACAFLALAAASARAAPAVQGDRIVNVVSVRSTLLPDALTSAPATVTVRIATPATLELLRFAPPPAAASAEAVEPGLFRTGAADDAPWAALAQPRPTAAAALSLPGMVPLRPATALHQGDPIFVRVTDLDQNLDRGARETLFVVLTDDLTGDTEVVRLTENGPDTGVFVGYVPTAGAGAATRWDGALRVVEASTVTARHVDLAEAADVASATAPVDPASRVFDSRSGAPVSGAEITLVDAATGLPAAVRADDGTTSFPSTVVSGRAVTDGAGRTVAFGPGEFRFPFVAPGTYRYDVRPPPGFAAPSRVTDGDLAALAGGPFAIATGSRGEPFQVDGASAVRLDVPVDAAAVSLWVRKTAGATRVGVGDFLAYEIAVTNLDAAVAAPGVTVRDALPAGFRYQRGSARRDGAPAADPAQTDDGRTLSFVVGELAPGMTATLRLVVQVGARAKVGVDAVNVASATSAGSGASNVAEARVRVADDLLATRSFLMGRVTTGECPAPGAEAAEGLAGVRVFLEDGTFSVSDRDGLFHFEAVRPGVHVVQLDVATLPAGLEVVACRQDDRFAGRAFSQLVDLQGGTLWRTDFHVRARAAAAPDAVPGAAPAGAPPAGTPGPAAAAPPVPAVALSLAHRVTGGDAAEVRARVHGGEAPVAEARLAVTLPDGLEYEPGSSVVDGAPGADPAVDGRTLTYPVGTIAPRAEWTVSLRARVRSGAQPGERTVSAMVSGAGLAGARVETSASPEVVRVETERVPGPLRFVTRPHFPTFGTALGAGDRAELAKLARRLAALHPTHLVVVGHTDDVPIAPRSRATYSDNAALSLARAGSVRAFLLPALRMREEQIDVVGKGDAEPLADNRTAGGRAVNRRVEVLIHDPETIDRTVLVAARDAGATASAPAAASVPAASAATAAEVVPASAPAPSTVAPAPATPAAATPAAAAPAAAAPAAAAPAASERDGFLSPRDGELVPDRIGAVQVRLASYLTPALAVEGKPVDAARIGYRSVDPRTGKTVYTYVGVDLGEQGTRTLTLTGTDPFGNVRVREQLAVTRTGEIAAMRLVSADGNVADGRTPVRVRVELLDATGDPIRGAMRLAVRGGTLRPYRAAAEPATLDAASSVGVDKDGWVLFEPVAETGSHRAVLACGRATLEVETWARPELRDWILVGLAEGTVGYGSTVKHMEALPPGEAAEELQADGRVAFYAKGQVRGAWLLTVAYDSRRGEADRDPLFQTIDPNSWFTLYGDATAERHDAPSTRKIYVKLEREQLYALFGDHETGLTVTELSRYSRRLNGVKAELRTRHAEATVFAAPTDAVHVRDELPGDGTSGLYRLSRRLVTVGSETVTVVTRDRFRSEVIRETRALTRFLDYAIDYDDGTILFREPIPSRSADLDPITVVVEYEAGATGEDWTAGGRAGVRLAEDRLRAGVTAIHQGEGDRSRSLYGADVAVKVGAHSRVRAEAAVTDATGAVASDVATAWLAEATHASHALEARAYAREQERGFGLGQQPLSEAGTRKVGLEAAKHVGDLLTVTGQAYRQDTFATGVERLFGETRLRLGSLGGDQLYVGVLEASDRLADGDRRESGQLTAGAKWLGVHDRLTLAADWAQSVWGDANADFPTRLVLRGEYKLTPDVAVTGTEELTWGAAGSTQTTRLGLRATPWKGGALTTSMGSVLDENAARVVGNLGLRQTLDLSAAWKVDLAAERSETVLESGAYEANPNVPPASGSVTGEDFTALSAGASYRIPHLVWDSRAELRTSESDRRWTVLSGAVLERGADWAFSGRAQLLGSRADGGDVATRASLRLGLVYRPPRTRWIVLNGLDATLEDGRLRTAGSPATSGLAVDGSLRLVDNLLASFRPSRELQVSLGYGAKWVRERFEDAVHAGFTDQASVELRRDLSPRWDVGLRASALHVWTSRQVAFSAGPSLGYSPAPNVWVSVGVNATGYDDRDFASASHAAVGPYVRMRIKLDQDSVKDAARWLNLQ